MKYCRLAPRGGAGKGAAFWITRSAALSNAAEPELREIETRESPPPEAIANATVAVPRELTRGLRTRLMRLITCPG